MIRITVGHSFLNLSILLQFAYPVVSRNPLPCDVWIKSNNKSVCDILEKYRPDVYQLTTPEQHPYSVLVYCKTGKDFDSVCSGTLVSRYWALTAGHCFKNCKESFVYAGGNSLYEVYSENYPEGSQLKRVGKICEHNRFDVALAKVKIKFDLTRYVNKIRLPKSPLPRKVVACNFTAFGRVMLNDSTKKIDYKRKTQEVKVVCPCDCYYRNWKSGKAWSKFADGSNFVCSVPREDYGVCKGDSGSGLVYKGRVYGVTTSIFTEEDIEACIFQDPYTRKLACGSRDTASVFVSVHPLVGWINRIISRRNVRKRYCYNSANAVVSSVSLGLTLLFASKYLTFHY